VKFHIILWRPRHRPGDRRAADRRATPRDPAGVRDTGRGGGLSRREHGASTTASTTSTRRHPSCWPHRAAHVDTAPRHRGDPAGEPRRPAGRRGLRDPGRGLRRTGRDRRRPGHFLRIDVLPEPVLRLLHGWPRVDVDAKKVPRPATISARPPEPRPGSRSPRRPAGRRGSPAGSPRCRGAVSTCAARCRPAGRVGDE